MRYKPESARLVAEVEENETGRQARAEAFGRALDDLPLEICLDLRAARNTCAEFVDEVADFSIRLMRQARTLTVQGADPSLRSALEARPESSDLIQFQS
jgi:hypothetical protein